MRSRWLGKVTLLLTLLSVPSVAACAADASPDEEASAEAALEARHVKVLAKDRAYPGDLFVAGDKVYWSESRQVASGDPELDQQFAYWTGKLFSFNVARSRAPKALNDLGSPLRSVAQVGDAIYLTTAGGVAKTTAADLDDGKAWTMVYRDYDHFEIDEEVDVTSSAVDGGRLYVLRSRGQLVSVKLDGSDYKLHVTGSDYAGNLAVSGSKAFFTAPSSDPNLTALFRVDLGAAKPTPVEVTRARSLTKLTVDGENVLFGASKSTIAGAPAGGVYRVAFAGGGPEVVVPGIDEVYGVAVDEGRVYVGGKRGTIEGVFGLTRTALGAGGRAAKIHEIKAAAELRVTPDAVFVASTALGRGNVYAGSVVRLAKAGIR